jgi:hypothetical protein
VSIRVPASGGIPRPSVPLKTEAAEGVRVCLYVLRMRLRNRIVVDVLTVGPTEAVGAAWCRTAAQQLRRLADEAETNGRRAAELLDGSTGAPGLAEAPHDYRWLDVPYLRRRARVGQRVAGRLRSLAGDRQEVLRLVREAGTQAGDEITVNASRLEAADAALVLGRVEALSERLVALGRRPRRRRR